MNQLQTVAMGFKEKWAQLSFSQKMMFGTILIGMILASVFLVQRTQDDYDVLYSNLSLPDASAMVAKLKEMKTPFKLADGGTTILVPRGSHDTLILETAGELNSENTISLSKIPPVAQGDVQREWIRKLNTDSIAQILMSIRGIKSAHVIVSQPDKSVFSDSEDPVTASVMLMVEPGFRLNEEQVKTIKNLVSHSVPGLTNDHVAIADNQGNSLEGNPMASNMGANGESEVDMRRKEFEKETSKKVLAILSPIVGKDNAVVSVSAVLNFDKAQSKIHRVIPAGGDEANPTGVAVSTQEQTEEYSGSGPKPEGGPAGVETNVTPGYVGEKETKAGSNYKSTKRTTNFASSEESKDIVYASGVLERMTVAVVLNRLLTERESEEIRELVANAAGVDESRGDSVNIKGYQFSEKPGSAGADLATIAQSAEQQMFWIQLASVAAMVILGLAALIVFYNLFKRPAQGEIVEEPEPYSYPDEEVVSAAEQLLESTSIPSIESVMNPEIEFKREAINNLVKENPEEAARVILTYMKET